MNGAGDVTPCSASMATSASSRATRPRRAPRTAAPPPAAPARRAPRRRARRRCRRRARQPRRRRPCRRRPRPTTTTLCASWATVEANAPARRPKPRTSPRPIRPGAVVALEHGDGREVARRIGDDRPSRTVGRSAGPVTSLPRHDVDHPHALGGRAEPEGLRRRAREAHGAPPPLRHGRCRERERDAVARQPTRPPATTVAARKRSRSSSTTRSAR